MALDVLILGATGFIGSHTVSLLLEQPAINQVIAISRRHLPVEHHKLVQRIGPLDNLPDLMADVRAQVIVLALGAHGLSPASYRLVDRDFGLQAATLARQQGVDCCIAVSSALASLRSPLGYLRTKAAFEQSLSELEFPSLVLLRPGPLLGRHPARWQETLFTPILTLLSKLWGGKSSPILPVPGQQVARCIVELCINTPPGITRLSSTEISAR